MNIRVGKYVITSDNLQFILNEASERGEKSKNQGEEYLRPISYHPTLDTLLTSTYLREMRQNEATNIYELIAHVTHCTALVEKMAEKFKGVGPK